MGILTPKNLKEYFISKLNSCREYSSLKYEYVNIRRVWNFWFYMVNDYPQVNLLINQSPKDISKWPINLETIEKTIMILRNEGDFENWLMLSLLSKYHLYPNTLTLVRFEDFGTKKNGKRFLKIFERRRMRHVILQINEETFAVVRELKKLRDSRKKHQYETKRDWGKGWKIKGSFIFPVQRCSIGKRLQNGFNGRVPEFSSSPLQIISTWKDLKIKILK